VPTFGDELRLVAMKLQLTYPGRNQPREKRWLSTVDAKYTRGDTNRVAKTREVELMKEGKGKTIAIAVRESPHDAERFHTNDLRFFASAAPVLSQSFTTLLGVKALRVTGENTNKEVQGKYVTYCFYANDLEYTVFAATFFDEAPEKDSEISAILKSLKWLR
jgi:hypothetical protein